MTRDEAYKQARSVNRMIKFSRYVALVEHLYSICGEELVKDYYVSIKTKHIVPSKVTYIQKAP